MLFCRPLKELYRQSTSPRCMLSVPMPCPCAPVWCGNCRAALSQIISGVGVGVYWLTTFVFDVATYLIPCGVFLGLLYAFDVPSK